MLDERVAPVSAPNVQGTDGGWLDLPTVATSTHEGSPLEENWIVVCHEEGTT